MPSALSIWIVVVSAVLLICCTSCSTVFAAEDEQSSSLDGAPVELDSNTFPSMIFDKNREQPVWLIQFYAPYSEESIRMAPMLGRVAKDTVGKMMVGKLDCSRFKPLCTNYGIKKYPTMVYYKEEQFVGYPFPYLDEMSLLRFADRMAAPIKTVPALLEAEEIAKEEVHHGVVTFVGCNENPDFDFYPIFEQQAHTLAATARFVWMNDDDQGKDFSKAYVMRLEPGITGNRIMPTSDRKPTADSLHDWIQKEKVPSVTTFHGDQSFAIRTIANNARLPWILAVGGVHETVTEDIQSFVLQDGRTDTDGHYFGIVDRSWTTLLQPYELPSPSDESKPQFIKVSQAGYWHDPSYTTVSDFVAALKANGRAMHVDLKRPRKSVTGERGLHWTAELFLDFYPMSLGLIFMTIACLVVLCTNDPNAPKTTQPGQRQLSTNQQSSRSDSDNPTQQHRGKKDSSKKSD
ncbi:thioredoxin [Nitzschia inconspicua]|uniref:Thioredoxin n=1 Tax=Nitzschia inconspicua TaxID=303405 RepID=A0A9K3LA86_9STRA|nr:thioredoxin [Nitzschia inconspicua]